MQRRNKSTKTKVAITSGKAHSRSPHILALEKTERGFILSDDAKRKDNYIDAAVKADLKNAVSTHHQFTKSVPLQSKKSHSNDHITVDLVNQNQPIGDDHIAIDQAIEDAFAQYHRNKPTARLARNATRKTTVTAITVTPHSAHRHVVRTTIIFALSALLITAPLYTARFVAHAQYTSETLKSISTNVVSSLKKAGGSVIAGNTGAASQEFNNVEAEFAHAVHLLESFERDTALIASTIPPVRSKIKTAQALSAAGLHVSQAIQSIKTQLAETPDSNEFAQLASALSTALSELEQAHREVNRVKPETLPADIRPLFASLKSEFDSLLPALKTGQETTATLAALLADNPRQTFLVIFQNNHEIRATGGFWGSFALVTIKNGKIDSFDIPGGGTYDLQGQLDRHVRPPAPLQLLKKEWQFQDANWFADFPTSAQAATWFLEHAKYGTPDGVVAITPNVLEKIIDLTGPIEMPTYGLTLTSQNITHELQKAAELDYDREENKPKEIISDLTAILLERTKNLSAAQKVGLLSIVHESLNKKDILAYHTNEALQQTLVDAGWSGSINQHWEGDYLMVVNHNIAGQKTDEKIVQDIIKQTNVHENGTVTTTLTIRRTHTGKKGDLFTGVRNVNYMRVMTPAGSELIHAEGFTYPDEAYFKVPDTFESHELVQSIESNGSYHTASGTHITTESGKTTFGNWTMTDPSDTTVVKLTYRLPFVIQENQADSLVAAFADASASYKLLVQKQPGADNTTITHSLTIPDSWDVIASTDNDGDLTESSPLDGDMVSGIVMKRRE